MKRVLERLPYSTVGSPYMLYFNYDCRFRWRVAQCEVRSTFACLVFGPNHARIESVPTEFLKQPENYPL